MGIARRLIRRYKMKKIYTIIISCIFLICCAQNKEHIPVGVNTFEELFEISKQVYQKADVDLFFQHTDLSGVPEETKSLFKKALKNWKKGKKRWKLKEIKVISFEDYDPNDSIPKEWSEDFRKKFYVDKNKMWNFKPSKIIIFNEDLIEQKTDIDKEASMSLIFAAFQREGLWYFASNKEI